MAKEETAERSTRSPEAIVISITVMDPPPSRGRPFRKRPGHVSVLYRALTAVSAALALAALGAVITTALPTNRATRPAGTPRAPQIPYGERAAIAGALGYPYPLRCLTITISATNPDYARADVDRTNGCGRYRGYINASLRRADGTWRLVLDEGQLFVPNSLLSAGAVNGADRYPLECLSTAIALHDPRFSRAAFDRTICTNARPR
jgi:hypothetical protein